MFHIPLFNTTQATETVSNYEMDLQYTRLDTIQKTELYHSLIRDAACKACLPLTIVPASKYIFTYGKNHGIKARHNLDNP